MAESKRSYETRKRIYEIIEGTNDQDKLGQYYNTFMPVVIVASLIPLGFKVETLPLRVLDKVAMVIFIIDYLLRWATADFKAGEKSVKVFIQYPFTTMAIVDLISILPSLTLVNESLKTLRALRMLRALRSIRVLKGMRYWKNFVILGNVLEKSKDSLLTVGTLAAAYILVSALVIFNVEPETFNTFFDALYWATISLTTVGYGDIYAVSTIGRLITMISSELGIAIVALPASIFTAEYIAEMRKHVKNKDDKK